MPCDCLFLGSGKDMIQRSDIEMALMAGVSIDNNCGSQMWIKPCPEPP
jgi:hypothetical protein